MAGVVERVQRALYFLRDEHCLLSSLADVLLAALDFEQRTGDQWL